MNMSPYPIAQLKELLAQLIKEAETKRSRELSLAITNLEQAIMWLEKA